MQRAAPYLVIVFAGLLAHGWCLGAQFYLDDQWQIAESQFVEGGEWWGMLWCQWTYFTYWLTYLCFGVSPAAFHVVNLALHLAIGCVVCAAGREFFRGTAWESARRFDAAFWAGLLFVVHPLGSEIPNYARCRDIAWMTLFSVMAAWFAMLWVRRGWKWFPWVVLFFAGAIYSKGPGLWHVSMMVGAVVAGCASWDRLGTQLRESRWLVAGCVLVVGIVFLASGYVATWWSIATGRIFDPRFGWHVLTLCRVMWEFVQRYLWPAGLSADHHIPWTNWAGDLPAWAALAGVVAWLGLIGFCFMKPRLRVLAVFQFLFVGAILLRMLYVINELMPEYRIYPGLPWIALFVVAVIWSAGRRLKAETLAKAALGVVVLAFVVVSANRSRVWWDEERLALDVLSQYPTQVRAVWLLQARDIREGRYGEVLVRHQRDYQLAANRFHAFNDKNRWKRKLDEGILALADVGSWGYYARALAELGSPGEALQVMLQLERNMVAHRLEDDVYWWIFYHDRGMILAKAGRYEKALEDLERGRWLYAWRKDEARVRELAEEAGKRPKDSPANP